VRFLLLLPSAVLLALGSEGLYHAFRGRERATVDCRTLTDSRPASHRLLVTGCEVDYAGVGYRGDGTIEELLFPARPAGQNVAAPIVIVTRDPAALAMAQPVLGAGRRPPAADSLAAMRSIAAAAHATPTIDGLVRAGFVERLRTRRILSGLSATPVAPDAMLIDLQGSPDFVRPLLALAGGLMLAALPFVLGRRASAPGDAVREGSPPAPARARVPVIPAANPAPALEPAVALPQLLLLNVGIDCGPEAVEGAPSLGSRAAVIEKLCGVVPDLIVDGERRILSRADRSLRIDLGRHDPVPTVVVDARGEAGAALVKEILLMTGWRAFAPKTGLFIGGDELSVMAALTRGD
jgi:hypothetical protein